MSGQDGGSDLRLVPAADHRRRARPATGDPFRLGDYPHHVECARFAATRERERTTL